MMNAARRLFVTQGFDRTSMDQVASEAGVSKRTVYSRCGSKADLFLGVARQLGHETLSELEAAADPEGTPYQVLLTLGWQLVAFGLDRDTIAMERMAMDMAQDFPELAKLRREQSRRTVAVVMRSLAHVNATGAVSPERLNRDAQVFLSMTVMPTLHRAMMQDPSDRAETEAVLARAIEIFLHGHTAPAS
ncbi:TetR family transcriptional regulator [Salipiger sp. IMCC34102]|nr:TetR family transcriptional regulator [Salipiger sp. IMCC34102]